MNEAKMNSAERLKFHGFVSCGGVHSCTLLTLNEKDIVRQLFYFCLVLFGLNECLRPIIWKCLHLSNIITVTNISSFSAHRDLNPLARIYLENYFADMRGFRCC